MAFRVTFFLEDSDGEELFFAAGLDLAPDGLGLGVKLREVTHLEHEGEVFELHELGAWAPALVAKATAEFNRDHPRLAAEFDRAEDERAREWAGR